MSIVMHECKSLTLTEHRHSVRSKTLINVTSRVIIPITNTGRFEIQVDSCPYHDSDTAVQINVTCTVTYITLI